DDELSDGTIVAEKAAATGAARPQPPAEGISESTPAPAGASADASAAGTPSGVVPTDMPTGAVPAGTPTGGASPAAPGSSRSPGTAPDAAAAGTGAASNAAADPAPRRSRAGRNLPAALAVGLTLGISCIAVLLFVPTVFIGVAGVAVGIATWEVAKRLREAD